MTPETPPAPSLPGIGTSLRAGLDAGLRVGVLAGTLDGLGAAAGVDSEFFALQWQLEGLGSALPGPAEALSGIASSVGSIAAAACVYGVVAGLFGLLAGGLLHPLLKGSGDARRRRHLFGMSLGVWLALAIWWWTRPVVLPGYSSLHPLRLAALGAILAGGQVLGALLAALLARTPRGLRLAAPFAAVGLLVAGGLYLATDAPGRGELGQPSPRNEDLPDVLLFVVDALRADALELEEVHTPVLDALASRGVMFENAMVQAPFTWSSFGSILTGKYPRRHGLMKMAPGVRMRPNITIPYYLDGARRRDGVQLEEEDYVGAAFMTGTLSHGSGLLRGFDYYCEALVGHGLTDVHSSWSSFRSKLLPWLFLSKLNQRVDREFVATTAVDWLRDNPEQRFVSMVHYYSTHTPYDPIEPHRSRYVDPAYDGPFPLFDAVHRIAIEDGSYEPTPADVQQIRDLYHGGVSMADAMIGRVLDELERQGRLENTIVIVTSDHGEELGEHGLWEHNFMYQTNLRVPLLISWPGGGLPEGQRIQALVETVDIFPTLCDLMDLELPEDRGDVRELLDGVSLVPLMKGQVDDVKRWSFAENGRFASIQDLEQKLIVRRSLLEAEGAWEEMLADPDAERPRFFDLGADPEEERDLFAERGEEALALFEELRAWSASMPIAESEFVESGRDRRNEELLRGLGYGAGVGAGLGEDGDD